MQAPFNTLKLGMRALCNVARLQKRTIHVEARIEALGLKMPSPAVPKGNFVNYVPIGNNLVFLSGHLPQVCLIDRFDNHLF
jgi:hypothetical protein